VPLWDDTARVLRAWFRELGDFGGAVAFPGARGQALSRDGVDHLLRRTVTAAAVACPSLGAKKVSPHVLRHSDRGAGGTLRGAGGLAPDVVHDGGRRHGEAVIAGSERSCE
jgi:site-specific recombinase XerC